MVAMFEMPGGGEWIVIAVIVALLFGAKRLPDIARNSGKALVEFKKAIGELRPNDEQTDQSGDKTGQPGQTQADPAASQASQNQAGASGASGRSAAE